MGRWVGDYVKPRGYRGKTDHVVSGPAEMEEEERGNKKYYLRQFIEQDINNLDNDGQGSVS